MREYINENFIKAQKDQSWPRQGSESLSVAYSQVCLWGKLEGSSQFFNDHKYIEVKCNKEYASPSQNIYE